MPRKSAQALRVERQLRAIDSAWARGEKYDESKLDALVREKARLAEADAQHAGSGSPAAFGRSIARSLFRRYTRAHGSSPPAEDLSVAADAIQEDRDVDRALLVLGLEPPTFEDEDPALSPREAASARNAFRKEFGKLVRTAVTTGTKTQQSHSRSARAETVAVRKTAAQLDREIAEVLAQQSRPRRSAR